MTDVIVRATAIRWESDDFPGWIEAAVVDAERHDHRVIDKVPVLSTDELRASTRYPVELWIRATMAAMTGERVAVAFTDGVETVYGVSRVAVRLSKCTSWRL